MLGSSFHRLLVPSPTFLILAIISVVVRGTIVAGRPRVRAATTQGRLALCTAAGVVEVRQVRG